GFTPPIQADSTGPLTTAASWIVEGNQVGANFGDSAGTAGDVNGDGYSDIVVAGRLLDNGEVDAGVVLVYYGSATGPPAAPSWMAESNQTGARFGTAAATAGDINGDGYDDLLIGAPLYDDTLTDQGALFVYLGSASGLATSPSTVIEGTEPGSLFAA